MKFQIYLFNTLIIMSTTNFSQEIAQSWAQETLNKMTLKEKIGQLFVIPVASCFDQPEEILATAMKQSCYNMNRQYVEEIIKEYCPGGLLFLFNSTPVQQVDFTNHYCSLSKYPLWIFQDCEWGLNMRLYQTIRFPRNMTLGAIANNELLYEFGKEVGRQCKVIGVDMNLAPVLDVNNNPANPVIADRSFGDDPEIVAQKGIHIMRGLQESGVWGCAKHFPGHGDTAIDSHVDLPVISHDKDRLHEIELVPFKEYIAAAGPAIMMAHLHVPIYDSEKNRASSLSHAIVTDLLKKELGFEGTTMTDGLGMKAVLQYYEPGDLELEAYLAGNDVILACPAMPAAVKKLEQAIGDGCISLEDLNNRVLKILRAKEHLHVHRKKFIDKKQLREKLHTPHAYALKKRLYQEAITIVHDKPGILPIGMSDRLGILQIGGTPESVFSKTLNTTKTVYSHISSQETSEKSGLFTKQFENCDTIAVAIFDINKFENKQFGLSNNTLELLRSLKTQGKRLIVTLFGTPYSAKYFKDEAAVIVAYEDDVDAQEAAAQVILGKIEAKGKLPVKI